ncbi:hypothetical protein P175DRAFT_0558415 [Aspergillus ochraceoroseus IBT 24754]|uniref:PhzF family phenazine biosynthesis protein n=1 Tax=Aspergillus ochraceoroseus IBT 24754 TaxID=1392256 RepID=A0A2T5LVA9_9EURO|nr:uncharacterized protein P175DRAFT_0558415 [Aspergillus ochraceoroseus IBT 24754]PTU20226.1 hypothetical protein P175DRAFT_0558415 [Aspergillus ochraceoroseus IBT 24754]
MTNQLQFVTLDVLHHQKIPGQPAGNNAIAREFNLSETIFVHADTGEKRTIEASSQRARSSRLQDIPTHYWRGLVVPSPLSHQCRARECNAQKLLMTAGEFPNLPASWLRQCCHVVSVSGASTAVAAVTTTFTPVLAEEAQLDEGWREEFVANYFFVRDVEDAALGKKVIRSRMILGSLEDPATGSAASGLAAYLSLLEGRPGQFRYDLVQGVEMGRRSEIGVDGVIKEVGKIDTLELQGSAVKVSEGKIVVPEE